MKSGWSNSSYITRSEQLLCSRVTAFLITSLFLEQSWREFWIPYKSHKPDRKTYRPEKGLLRKLWNEVNWFPVSHKVNVIHIHGITQNEERMKYVELITHKSAIRSSYFSFSPPKRKEKSQVNSPLYSPLHSLRKKWQPRSERTKCSKQRSNIWASSW